MKSLFVSDFYNMKKVYLALCIIAVSSAVILTISCLTGKTQIGEFVCKVLGSSFSTLSFMFTLLIVSFDAGSRYREYAIASFVSPKKYLAEKYIISFLSLLFSMGLAFVFRFFYTDMTADKLRRFFALLIYCLTLSTLILSCSALSKYQKHITAGFIISGIALLGIMSSAFKLFPFVLIYDAFLIISSFRWIQKKEFEI